MPVNVYFRNGGSPKKLIPGDANLDGCVDVGDLGILGANYGKKEDMTWSQADFNGDRMVDIADLGILGANYGKGSGEGMRGGGEDEEKQEAELPPLGGMNDDGKFDIEDVRIYLEKYAGGGE